MRFCQFRQLAEAAADVVGQFVEQHDLSEVWNLEPGDKAERVIWETHPGAGVPSVLETHPLSNVGLPSHPGVYALHVTSDTDYWIDRLDHDYGRDPSHAHVIEIVLIEGDRVVEDHQYAMDPEGGDKASSAILLTTRRTLRKGTDFDTN